MNCIAELVRSTPKLHTGDTEKVLIRCRGYAEKLELLFKGIDVKPPANTPQKAWRAVCALEREKEIMALFESLGREKLSLTSLTLLNV